MDNRNAQDPVEDYVSCAISSLKKTFEQEYLRQPSVQDIANWYLGIVDKREDPVCAQCHSKSLPCTSLALTIVSCAQCATNGAESVCTRYIKEREARVKRVLNLDTDTFNSFLRSSFVAQNLSSSTVGLTREQPSADEAQQPIPASSNTYEQYTSPDYDSATSIDMQSVGDEGTQRTAEPGPPPYSTTQPSAELNSFTTESAPASNQHDPTSALESSNNDYRTSPKKLKNIRTFKIQLHQVQKELQTKVEQLEGQLDDAKANLNDSECKLKDEIARTTDLNQQLEAYRRETGDLRRSHARLEEKIKGREEDWNKREAKTRELEVKVKKGEHELRVAKRKHEEKLKEVERYETGSQGGGATDDGYGKSKEIGRSVHSARTVESWTYEKGVLEETIAEQEKSLTRLQEIMEQRQEETKRDFEVILAQMKQSMDQTKLENEREEMANVQKERALRQCQEIEHEKMKRNLKDEIAQMKGTIDQMGRTRQEGVEKERILRQQYEEVLRDYKDQIRRMELSMEEMKPQIEQSRQLQGEWKEKAEARNVELQQIKQVLNQTETALSAERKSALGTLKTIDELEGKLRVKPNIDLAPIHNNIELLVQQFHSLRTSSANNQVSNRAFLETCDYLGWQLVAISDSISEGLKKNDNEAPLTLTTAPTPIRRTSNSKEPNPFKVATPTASGLNLSANPHLPPRHTPAYDSEDKPTTRPGTDEKGESRTTDTSMTGSSHNSTQRKYKRQTARKSLGSGVLSRYRNPARNPTEGSLSSSTFVSPMQDEQEWRQRAEHSLGSGTQPIRRNKSRLVFSDEEEAPPHKKQRTF